MTLAELPPWFLPVFATLLGLLWGSFVNVVIYRVPREMSVVRPGSRCPSCEKPIAPYDNIPVLSYFILRGKTRCCGTKLSPRYPAVEALGGVLAYGVYWHLASALGSGAELWRFAIIFSAELALVLGLLAAAFIDVEHMILPDSITIGGAILGLATAPLRGLSIVNAGVSAAVAFVLVWFVFNVLYRKLRGRTGMGMGDAKLLALAGAWFGMVGGMYVLFASAIQGAIITVAISLIFGKVDVPESVKKDIELVRKAAEEGDEEAKKALDEDPLAEEREGFLQAAIPFGPFLILSIFEYLFFGNWINAHIFGLIFP